MRPATALTAAFVLLAGIAPLYRCASRSHPPVADSTMTTVPSKAHPEAAAGMAAPASETKSSDMEAPDSGMEASNMEASPAAANAPIVPVVSDDPFIATVRPVLSVRCAPCHEPGGKMYARLPFDDSKTVSSNSAGILRRLQGDDRAALEKWIAGLPAAAPAVR